METNAFTTSKTDVISNMLCPHRNRRCTTLGSLPTASGRWHRDGDLAIGRQVEFSSRDTMVRGTREVPASSRRGRGVCCTREDQVNSSRGTGILRSRDRMQSGRRDSRN